MKILFMGLGSWAAICLLWEWLAWVGLLCCRRGSRRREIWEFGLVSLGCPTTLAV